jgi:hypothetical protein
LELLFDVLQTRIALLTWSQLVTQCQMSVHSRAVL